MEATYASARLNPSSYGIHICAICDRHFAYLVHLGRELSLMKLGNKMSAKFNREFFVNAFNAAIEALAQSEQVTKRELRSLSRTVLEATHETGDIQYINKLIAILTPVHKKVAVVFFKHFSGFSYDDGLKTFTKKSKKRYDKAFLEYVAFMSDPLNNIWTWAERNIEIEQKDFDLSKVTVYMKTAMKKAKEQGKTNADVLKAVIAAGMTADDVIAIMEEVGMEATVKE
jgi:hypothetical protein